MYADFNRKNPLKPKKYISNQIIVRHYGDSATLPYLYAIKFACHSFMDAGRRYKTPGSELKDNLFLSVILVTRYWPNSHRVVRRGLGNGSTCSDLYYRKGIHKLGNLNLL